MEQDEEVKKLINELQDIVNQEEVLDQNKLELAFKQGEILEKLKSTLPHGEFLNFLESNTFNMKPRKAQRMMKLKANEELIRSKATNLSLLSIDKAFQIISEENNNKKRNDKPPRVNVHELEIKSGFNEESQRYEITLSFTSDELKMAQKQMNFSIITRAVKERIKNLSENPSLLDLAALSNN